MPHLIHALRQRCNASNGVTCLLSIAMVPTPLTSSAEDGSTARDAGRPFGRFRLLRLLGRSDQSMAWLAWDPRMSQEVTLTMPRVQPLPGEGLERWQQRVRSAARLSHPHLAHVVEVGIENHWPYVTVDRALGVTLDEWLAIHPLPAPLEAVTWVCELLEGLAFAHEAGVAHGDLEPHSLLIGETGVIRCVGLGVASGSSLREEAGVRSQLDTRTLQAQRSLAARDVLAAGLLLHRLLSGQMPLEQSSFSAATARLAPDGHEVLRLSRTTPQPVAEALRAIAHRATSPQERQRYLNARSLLRALDGWRHSEAQGQSGPLAVLMERLNTVGHLPSRPGGALDIGQPGRWEARRNDEIAEHILQDVALTLEMLKQVNTVLVQGTQAAGAPSVITVRRAVALIGMNGVRQCGTALRRWPGPLSEPTAQLLQDAIDRVRLAGGVAQSLAPAGYDPEVIYLTTLMQNLGRLLVHYHFAEEAEQIRHLMRPVPSLEAGLPDQPGLTETVASFGVLGVEIDTLGACVAKHWGLGEDVQHLMHRLPPERPVRAPDTDVDWLRLAASAANEVVDAVTLLPSAQWSAAFSTVAQRYARVLSLDVRDLHEALKQAREMVRRGDVLLHAMPGLPVVIAPVDKAPFETPSAPSSTLRARAMAKPHRNDE